MEDVQYSHIPLALLLRKQVEVFIEYPRDENGFRFAPLRVINEGEIFGVFEVLDHLIGTPAIKPGWSVSSGSRSVWIVAPLGNMDLTNVLSNLAGADVNWDAEDEPQWKLIQQCAMAQKADWQTEVIVFPKALFQSVDRSSDFFRELLSVGWKQSSTLRHSSLDDTDLREAVNRAMRKSALPGGEMHHYSAVRHFLNIINGAAPAYQSSQVVDQPAGPFAAFCALLRKALSEMDRSRKYHPLIMQPRHLTAGEAGFYSCRCPSLPALRLDRPDTYLRLTEAYRDVINSIKGDYSRLVNNRTISLFASPAGPSKSLPRGIVSVDTLQLADFFKQPPKEDLASTVYLKSPFLVSCMRLTSGIGEPKSASTAR
jgi:hypothetical protein